MCKKTQPQKLAAARIRTRLFVACGVLAAGTALPASADVVTFDNSDGQFHWRYWGGGPPGNLFDPTLSPAEQDAASPERSYEYWLEFIAASDYVASEPIHGGANATIARDTVPVIVPSGFYEFSFFPPTVFNSGDIIGPDANWQRRADAGYDSYCCGSRLLLGPMAYVGIRLNLADGTHYGFIMLATGHGGVGDAPYQPVSWGYETAPDTPVLICDADFNFDGVANSQDFFDFLNLYFASDPRADFDHSGTVDSQDFFTFLNAFLAGC